MWRCIESGMVTMTEVKQGIVTLADIQRITAYLDMKSDVEYKITKDAGKGAKR